MIHSRLGNSTSSLASRGISPTVARYPAATVMTLGRVLRPMLKVYAPSESVADVPNHPQKEMPYGLRGPTPTSTMQTVIFPSHA